ncbi:YppG family protein [Lentibacillus sp. CBA3610]|uniref:YppG family protein n=1 Tax=Lentibacillus sp. CBA3610 TaxID=2518176 RepID=UPI0015962B82|nr:YppG family protein [Lentibacillus sp. CBA3610]
MRRSYPFWPADRDYQVYSPYITNPVNTNYNTYYQTPFEAFAKPKQPMNWQPHPQYDESFSQSANPNNLLYYFQDNNGELDLDKMLSTAGQVANTVQQISPVVKQVGNLMNQIR